MSRARRDKDSTLLQYRADLLVFVTNRKAPTTNNASERAPRPGVVFREATNGFRSQWGGPLFAAVRSVIDAGRPNGLSVFQAIRATLDGNTIFMPA